MTYSRAIDGRQDRQRLAELFRRIGAELRRQDEVAQVFLTASASQPDGKARTAAKRSPAILTAPDVCPALPSRTAAGAVFF